MTFQKTQNVAKPSALIFSLIAVLLLCFAAAAQTGPTDPPSVLDHQVLSAKAEGLNVIMSIEWSDSIAPGEQVQMVLSDRFGEELTSEWIDPVPGQISEAKFAGVLADATSRAQHHEVHLLDEAGQLVGDHFPFQVQLDCVSEFKCDYLLINGLYAPDMIYLDPAMADALEEARLAGATDELAWVAAKYDDMWGDIFSMSWQLKMLAPSPNGNSGCSCFWLITATHGSLEIDGARPNTCGCTHDVTFRRKGVQTRDAELILGGTSDLTLDTSCWTVGSAETHLPILGDGQTVEIDRADLGPCSVECGGSIVFDGQYSVDMHTNTLTAGDGAEVYDGVNFSLDSTLIFLDSDNLASNSGLDRVLSKTTNGVAFGVPGSKVTMVSGTEMSLHYSAELFGQSNGSGDHNAKTGGGGISMACDGSVDVLGTPCAEAQSRGYHWLLAQGQAACTGPKLYISYSIFLPNNVRDLGGDDIQILVGKCDG